MRTAPNAQALAVAAIVAVVVVGVSRYWQPNSTAPVTVEAALVFTAAALILGRFRPFRRP